MRTAQQELRRNYQSRPKPTPNFIDVNTDSESIVVNAPVSEVYHRCLRFEEFPAFISSIKKINRIDDTRFSCASIINGKEVKSDVLIMMRVPDRRIAWQAVSDHFRGPALRKNKVRRRIHPAFARKPGTCRDA